MVTTSSVEGHGAYRQAGILDWRRLRTGVLPSHGLHFLLWIPTEDADGSGNRFWPARVPFLSVPVRTTGTCR